MFNIVTFLHCLTCEFKILKRIHLSLRVLYKYEADDQITFEYGPFDTTEVIRNINEQQQESEEL